MSNEKLKEYDEDRSGCGCGCNNEHEHNHEDSCGCGCGEHEHEGLAVEMEDENGKTVTCHIVDGFKFKEDEYAVVDHPESESVYLFKVVGDDETAELVLPNDEEFEEASKYYSSLED
ncbi:DUF1292 domain-containing protein [Clostridium tyrobutyricum]|jgi:hypothetical protein|uniref:DUF1292 domain-containing protein n=1 Tax=Clostridium tyrobutyricum TaxID=1519 RepID=UPI0018AB0171|nr:DUF1292 domain-containing protein [Clostridium tyrobutyricum]MBR9648446.1 DUF1292 domain-containing protein [Clostridium tyrobutyricum]MBV4416082.1 DUF1292 domain-containing protein [Clostridium tyrobutyricum]MBV4421962.1 DUF1292 domain-containing protein [Clostridium tyrobutyricum]MBV4424194.1 DUF1292 domain-containing protein [Clostridium tyrobutyricum]MBV4428352.1 DUF1292 domain-containing protein [Clostridium tyrobutyricum]